MSATATVRVIKDTNGAGLDALIKRLDKGEHRVLVGVPAGKTEPDGKSTAFVAATVEFGMIGPERPFLRGGVRAALPQVRRVAASDLSDVARGTKTMGVALDRAGIIGAGSVKAYMAGPNFAPNAPSTIARKGSSQPTVDTASVRQNITHVVEGKV
jgi:hypothetical protein